MPLTRALLGGAFVGVTSVCMLFNASIITYLYIYGHLRAPLLT